ncbi:SLAP domain-containing protein [Companilactobacillus kedongensis]|uniref:SLAP domain-containing protein n=1 Tax=Companilactobacillus kedongensis TaxID=2486004 RepID=UPI000F7A04A7|nr:SLAP domain-containing protein [Companilactobacillus kedongensis]
MKKTIKYAGIAAAALLAVAPVAAPAMTSTTTNVQADTSYPSSDDVTAYSKMFKESATYSASQAAKFSASDLDTTIKADAFLKNDFFSQFTTGTYSGNVDDTNGSVKVSAFGENDKPLDADGVTAALKAAKTVKFIAVLEYDSGSGITATVSIPLTLTPTSDQTSTITSLAANFTTPYKVNYGSKTDDAKAQSSTDLSLTDQDNKALLSDNNEVSSYSLGGFFNSYSDALNGGTAASVGSTFTNDDGSATEYYQPITVTVSANSALDVYLATNNNNSTYTINGTSKAATDNGKVSVDANGYKTITFVRTVDVSQASEWTVKDVKGVVNTHSDKAYYTLHNDDDELVSNRALDKNSSWQTDKVRTDRNGNKQYRVSTHEWIPASEVDFEGTEIDTGTDTDTGSTTDPEGGLTVTKLAKNKIINVSTEGMVYYLYNSKGVISDTRALGGGTSWQVDKTAVDADGNVYYGVSTDEFVKAGEGVSLV